MSAALIVAMAAKAQPITEKFARFLTIPNNYVCYRTADKINVDGKLDEKSWQNAAPVGAFVDISGEGFPTPRYNTQAKMLWDDEYLYVAAELDDPHVWADIKTHDEVVYYNNDFEIFIDPDGDPRGTADEWARATDGTRPVTITPDPMADTDEPTPVPETPAPGSGTPGIGI